MTEVSSIEDYQRRDSIAVLQCLLERALRGELAGVAVYSCSHAGETELAATGVFGDQSASSLCAALQASWLLTQVEQRWRGKP